MAESKDLNTMLEIVSLEITHQETEEEFLRRSARSSTNEIAKNLFLEMTDDLAHY